MNKTTMRDPAASGADELTGSTGGDLETLVKQNLALAYSIANKYARRGLSLEDLRQEALVGILLAARHYNPSREASFSSYAVYWIKKQLLQAISRENATSLQAGELEESHLAEQVASEPSLPEDIAPQLPAEMPAAERRIILLSYGQCLSLKEISRLLGISVEQVKQLRGKALRRIKRHKEAGSAAGRSRPHSI